MKNAVTEIKPIIKRKARTAMEMILGLEKFDGDDDEDFPRWVVKSFSRTSDIWGIAFAEDWERESFSTRERAFVLVHTLLVALFASAVVEIQLRCYRRQQGLSTAAEYLLAGILQPVFKFFLLTWFIKYIFEQSIQQGSRLKTCASKTAHAVAAAIMIVTGLIAVSALFYKPEVRQPCSEYRWRTAKLLNIAYLATNWLFGETVIAFFYTAVAQWLYNKRWRAVRTDLRMAHSGVKKALKKGLSAKGDKGGAWGGGGEQGAPVSAQMGTVAPMPMSSVGSLPPAPVASLGGAPAASPALAHAGSLAPPHSQARSLPFAHAGSLAPPQAQARGPAFAHAGSMAPPQAHMGSLAFAHAGSFAPPQVPRNVV